MHVVLVHNPSAGSIDCDRQSLAELIRAAGHTVEDFSSKDKRWRQALRESPDLAVAAGGDGTVAQVARRVAGKPVRMAVLPFGTANNIASALNQRDMSVEDLVAGWADGRAQPFDLGLAIGPWGDFVFLESVGAGLLADAIAEIDQGSAGHVNDLDDPDDRLTAAWTLLERMLREAPARRFELTLDGRDLSGEYVLVEALNFGAAGPNLRLAPQATPSDGLLDVVLIDEHAREALLRQFPLLRDDPSLVPSFRSYSGRRLQMRCGDATLHLDDELQRTEANSGEVHLSITPGAVTFLLSGAGAEASLAARPARAS